MSTASGSDNFGRGKKTIAWTISSESEARGETLGQKIPEGFGQTQDTYVLWNDEGSRLAYQFLSTKGDWPDYERILKKICTQASELQKEA